MRCGLGVPHVRVQVFGMAIGQVFVSTWREAMGRHRTRIRVLVASSCVSTFDSRLNGSCWSSLDRLDRWQVVQSRQHADVVGEETDQRGGGAARSDAHRVRTWCAMWARRVRLSVGTRRGMQHRGGRDHRRVASRRAARSASRGREQHVREVCRVRRVTAARGDLEVLSATGRTDAQVRGQCDSPRPYS